MLAVVVVGNLASQLAALHLEANQILHIELIALFV
jgi:hypothetical protein